MKYHDQTTEHLVTLVFFSFNCCFYKKEIKLFFRTVLDLQNYYKDRTEDSHTQFNILH